MERHETPTMLLTKSDVRMIPKGLFFEIETIVKISNYFTFKSNAKLGIAL